jgi:hypothetical protein
MSQQGKLSPLGINVLTSLLSSQGLAINATASQYMGSSTGVSQYTKGSIISSTVLDKLVSAVRLAYTQIGTTVSQPVYDSLIALGSSTIPALGNSKPTAYTPTYTGEATSYGFLRTLPLQAHTVFNYGNSYAAFVNSFMMAHGFAQQSNKTIASLINSKDYLSGVYSNMNDLITGDVTGVSIATTYWGQDLIATGRAIDLTKIATFGNPHDLLVTLATNNSITKAVNIALVAAGLTTTEINQLVSGATVTTVDQQRKIYSAFSIVMGNDLSEVVIPLNVQIPIRTVPTGVGLDSLADLLNPRKLFPTSYVTLTVPRYNVTSQPTNSKIYYLVYNNTGINSQLAEFGYGKTLMGIIPDDVAVACGAFSASMQQIKNISSMNIEKFAQVVTHLEPTTELPLVNGTDLPVATAGIDAILSTISKGAGDNGTYSMYDFFGSMTGINYALSSVQNLITELQTTDLVNIYSGILAEVASPTAATDANLTALIAQANAEIQSIYNNKPAQAQVLNDSWRNIGTLLSNEIAARTEAIPDATNVLSNNATIYSFIDNINGVYAEETEGKRAADVLESICDLTTIGGQSIVATMRETRNAKRLGFVGGVLDNDIPDVIPTAPVNGLGITRVTGAAIVPGSFAGSPETNLIPSNLDIFNISSVLLPSVVTPQDAVEQVIFCNCDCWSDL